MKKFNPMKLTLRNGFIELASILILLSCNGCSTLPESSFKHHTFPQEDAYFGNVDRPYITLGTVRSKVDFSSLDDSHEEKDLCRNFFNKSVRELLSTTKAKGGDAVIDIKSVVYLEDGKKEKLFPPRMLG